MRWPLIPTIVVAAAVVAMVTLGIWQLQRKDEKEGQIALYSANMKKSAVSYPTMPPVPQAVMYRKSSANCLEVVDWQASAGKDEKGQTGFRYIAQCKTAGAEGPGLILLAGVADRPDLKPAWTGGIVQGIITTEPDTRSLIQQAAGRDVVLRPMLIATTPIVELRRPMQPKPAEIKNNHLSYAVQWFLFALVASVIYVLALRRKQVGLTQADQ